MPWPKGMKYSEEHIAKRSASLIASGKKRKTPVVLDGVTYWKCGTCKVYKPEAEFYMDGKTVAGVASVCKKCHLASSIRTRDKNNARELNAEHMRRARAADPEKFREREREASRNQRHNSPEKVAARAALNNAVKRGDITKPNRCEQCGQETRLTGHHDDYSMPLDVRWLCYSCHGKEHRVVEFKRVT
jgi:Pyruvate/2-oxoacid:ferredoxin oxidoreductase delta subunit/ribosomal protein S27AE